MAGTVECVGCYRPQWVTSQRKVLSGRHGLECIAVYLRDLVVGEVPERD